MRETTVELAAGQRLTWRGTGETLVWLDGGGVLTLLVWVNEEPVRTTTRLAAGQGWTLPAGSWLTLETAQVSRVRLSRAVPVGWCGVLAQWLMARLAERRGKLDPLL